MIVFDIKLNGLYLSKYTGVRIRAFCKKNFHDDITLNESDSVFVLSGFHIYIYKTGDL